MTEDEPKPRDEKWKAFVKNYDAVQKIGKTLEDYKKESRDEEKKELRKTLDDFAKSYDANAPQDGYQDDDELRERWVQIGMSDLVGKNAKAFRNDREVIRQIPDKTLDKLLSTPETYQLIAQKTDKDKREIFQKYGELKRAEKYLQVQKDNGKGLTSEEEAKDFQETRNKGIEKYVAEQQEKYMREKKKIEDEDLIRASQELAKKSFQLLKEDKQKEIILKSLENSVKEAKKAYQEALKGKEKEIYDASRKAIGEYREAGTDEFNTVSNAVYRVEKGLPLRQAA